MPTYTFRNTETNEQFDQFMSISQREKFLEENPKFQTIIEIAPAIGDPVRLGVKKIDSGFKEVLNKIHTKTPGSILNKTTNL